MWIVSSLYDRSVWVWDASTGVELKALKGHTDSVRLVAFSSNGTQIVSGSNDGSVRVWDTLTGVELKELKGHTNCIFLVAFSSDGTWIVSGSSDKSVWVWDVSTGVELKELKGHTNWVTSVTFSSNGTQVVSGSYDNSVQVWDVSMIGYEHCAWDLAPTNWIISSQGQNHIMWVPQGAGLLLPFNIITISCFGFATVEFCQSMIGVDWVHSSGKQSCLNLVEFSQNFCNLPKLNTIS